MLMLKAALIAVVVSLTVTLVVLNITKDPTRGYNTPAQTAPKAFDKPYANKPASSDAPACSYDGNFDNDPPGCK